MATTGTQLEVPHIVNTSGATIGQGAQPEAWVLYSTDDASVSTPTWNDATSYLRGEGRGFSTSRGRESELAEVDAGTATITLDNRTRVFDPVNNAAIRPLNRWWIREQFTGETQDIFKGYAESYDQQWPAPVGDALAVVSCADEFKLLALNPLPVMNPPRDTYEDLIKSDNPAGYWRWSDLTFTGTAGNGWSHINGIASIQNDNPIVGEQVGDPEPRGSLLLPVGSNAAALTNTPESHDTRGSSFLTVEFWYKFSALPGATRIFYEGATGADLGSGVHRIFWFALTASGTVQFNAHDNSNTLTTVTSTVLQANTWYYVAVRIGSDDVRRLYINGAENATTAGAGVLRGGGNLDPDFPPALWQSSDAAHSLDEIAIYPARDLGADRIAAHYEAGTERGFRDGLLSGTFAGSRLNEILDAAESDAPRRFSGGGNAGIAGRFMHGQDALGELRSTVKAESIDSVLFTARDGAIVFLDAEHRTFSPWNTVQVTFDDDGTDLPYADLDLDYSEAFLFNEWNVTRSGGLLHTDSDSTSISKYGRRSQSLNDIPIASEAYAAGIPDRLVTKYKDPFTRITSIVLTTHLPDVAEAIFRREIGDRIRVFRTPPGGGSRIDQTLFIQKIDVTAQPGQPWTIRWGVSPL